MSNILQLQPKPKHQTQLQKEEHHPEAIAVVPSHTVARRTTPRLTAGRRHRRVDSSHSGKLQKFKQRSSIEMLRQSVPLATHEFRLSHQLYVQRSGQKVALQAQRIGSLAVVLREGFGYQLFSWELRTPISSLLFDTFGYCYEAAVELGQRFDIAGVMALQPFGSIEKVDAMIQDHLMRQQVAMGQG